MAKASLSVGDFARNPAHAVSRNLRSQHRSFLEPHAGRPPVSISSCPSRSYGSLPDLRLHSEAGDVTRSGFFCLVPKSSYGGSLPKSMKATVLAISQKGCWRKIAWVLKKFVIGMSFWL